MAQQEAVARLKRLVYVMSVWGLLWPVQSGLATTAPAPHAFPATPPISQLQTGGPIPSSHPHQGRDLATPAPVSDTLLAVGALKLAPPQEPATSLKPPPPASSFEEGGPAVAAVNVTVLGILSLPFLIGLALLPVGIVMLVQVGKIRKLYPRILAGYEAVARGKRRLDAYGFKLLKRWRTNKLMSWVGTGLLALGVACFVALIIRATSFFWETLDYILLLGGIGLTASGLIIAIIAFFTVVSLTRQLYMYFSNGNAE